MLTVLLAAREAGLLCAFVPGNGLQVTFPGPKLLQEEKSGIRHYVKYVKSLS